MKTKYLIVDDEAHSRSVIQKHIEKLGDTEIVAECENPMKAIEVLRGKVVDIMVLDIEMPGMNGLEFLHTLSDPPTVIITTAFSEFAVDGFELDVLDYLLKPVTFERFAKAVNKYDHLNPAGRKSREKSPNKPDERFLYIKEGQRTLRIYFREIHYMEEIGGSLRFHLDHSQVMANLSLEEIENKLPGGLFLRIQNTCMVAKAKIRAFNTTTIEMEHARLSLGRKYREQVFSALHYSNEI